jgi:hypothetical protein
MVVAFKKNIEKYLSNFVFIWSWNSGSVNLFWYVNLKVIRTTWLMPVDNTKVVGLNGGCYSAWRRKVVGLNGGCYSPWRRYMQKLGFHFIVWTVFLKYLCGLMAQPALSVVTIYLWALLTFISTHCWPVSQGVGREGMWKLIRSIATPLPSSSSLPPLTVT